MGVFIPPRSLRTWGPGSRPLAQEGHTITRVSVLTHRPGQRCSWPRVWTHRLDHALSAPEENRPSLPAWKPFPPRGPQEPESASSQQWRVQRGTGATCGQPAGSDTNEERKVRGYGSASYPTCPFVCRFALGVFKEQGLDLGGISSRSWAPFLQGLSCHTDGLLLRRTTHVSRSYPLAPSGEGLCRSHY